MTTDIALDCLRNSPATLSHVDESDAYLATASLREREADRARYPDPAFNAWLDQSAHGFTVWNMLDDTGSAWAAWDARGSDL